MANRKLARWDEAEADTTKALVMSPRNLKALFRRGVARKELRKWDQAREDIQMFIDNGGDPTLGAEEFKAISDAESSPSPDPFSNTSGNIDSGLANIHLQDDTSVFTIHTSTTIQEGKGAFASRDIQRGDLILSETPIFSIPTHVFEPSKYFPVKNAVRNLSPVHLDEYLSLHNSHTECPCFQNPLAGIYSTNAFDLSVDDTDSGICLKASRFNHSCSPNAKFSFNSNTGVLRIYALGTIPCGEEIFIAYINGRGLYGAPRRSRRAFLRHWYHFNCACSICSLSEAEYKKSDIRRVKANELREKILSYNPSPLRGKQLLNVIVEGIHLFQEEGYLADTDDFTIYAGIVCALHSDWASTKYWAGLTYRTRVAEYGEDSQRAAEVRGYYLNPRSVPLAGCGPLKKFTTIRV
ncbi:hypothetical protein EI94DRAFT_81785 [Lactarius quietus]|nr:hypothetical protein EI94DRAFT_81785 [Lactarius quietus]